MLNLVQHDKLFVKESEFLLKSDTIDLRQTFFHTDKYGRRSNKS